MEYLNVLTVWQWVGGALAAWVLWDLMTGKVYLHRGVVRSGEPLLYWAAMYVWAALAASCLYSPYTKL